MARKKQDNTELIIGVAFMIVLGAGLFAILINNSLPGAQDDPAVKVKDDTVSDFNFGDPDTFANPSSSNNETLSDPNNPLSLDQEDNMPETSADVKRYSRPPAMVIEEDVEYAATINTSAGNIQVDLFSDRTPITVNNFVFLARDGFYNGTRSHRIMKGFMVQFGDPLTKDVSLKNLWGTGDPGYKFDDEPFSGSYDRGVVAMANSGPNTNGSQFFIMHKATPLPKNYVIFGQVTDDASLEVLDKIAETPVAASPSGEQSFPTEDVVISSIEVVEKSD